MGSRISAFKRDEEVWLVKSGDRIVGPFSTDEIINKVRNREIAVIDEVIAPLSRWKYVRDEPEFAGVVEETRRGLMSGSDNTEIQGYTSTSTPTHSLVEPVTVVTEAPVQATPPEGKEIVIEPVNPAPPSMPGSSSRETTSPSIRQYGVSDQTDVNLRLRRFSLSAWLFAFAVLGGAVYLMMRASAPKTDETVAKSMGFDALVAEGDQSWQLGRFEDALRSFRHANQLRPGNPEISPRLAVLLIQVEGQTVAAKRVLFDVEALSAASIDPQQKRMIEVGYGLAALFSEDFAEAQMRFKGVLAANPKFFPAIFNVGMSFYRGKNFDKAMSHFASAGDEPAALLMTGLSAVALGKTLKAPRRKEAERAIQRLYEKHFDYRQEAYIVGAALDLDAGDAEAAAVKARAALDVDPDLTQDHWHDPSLFLDPLGWRTLLPLCRRLNDEIKSVPARALMAYCLGRVGEREDASKIINDALGPLPDESLLHAVNAYLLFRSGRIEDARGAVRMAGRQKQPTTLANLMRARLCVHASDDACAEEGWRLLAAATPPVLASLSGLADVYQRGGKKTQAAELTSQALALSPRYLPAVRARAAESGGSQ